MSKGRGWMTFEAGVAKLEKAAKKGADFVQKMAEAKDAKQQQKEEFVVRMMVAKKLKAWWDSRVEGMGWYACDIRKWLLKQGDRELKAEFAKMRVRLHGHVGAACWSQSLTMGFIQLGFDDVATVDVKVDGVPFRWRKVAPDVVDQLREHGIWVNANLPTEEREVARFVADTE